MESNKHKKKQLDIRSFNYSYRGEAKTEPEIIPVYLDDSSQSNLKKWLKRIGIVLAIAILIALILVGIGYLIVDRTRLKGEEDGRVNILISGVDEAAKLSDTLMIISLDTNHEEKADYRAAIISIPRDLYVQIPPFGGNKINAAYSLGEVPANEVQGGGLALIKETVEDIFDIPVHYQMAVDFQAFEDIVNTVGGITIDVPKDIYDANYPTPSGNGQQLVQFKAGKQKMDGASALKYARSRQSTSDFDRSARQQQVMLAVKDKVLSPEFALDQSKIRSFISALQEHIKIDMTTPEILRSVEIGQAIPDQNIKRHVLDNEDDNLLTATRYRGYTLSPRTGNFVEIQDFINNIFTKNENTLPKSHLKEVE